MHHFQYRDGRLHAEDVDLTGLAAEVGTPFYCYSTATLERHYRVFAEAFAGDDALVCFAMKANSNQAVLRDARGPGRRHGHRLGGRAAAGAGGRGRSRQDRVLGRRQDPRRDGGGAQGRHLLLQCRERAGARGPVDGGRRPRRHGAGLDPGESRRRCRHARQDLHRQVREQVRHSDHPGARGLRRRRVAAGPRGARRRHAYRQPDHRSRALRRRGAPARRPRPGSCWRRAIPCATSTSAAASGSPTATTTPRPRTRPRWRRRCGRISPRSACGRSSRSAG